MLDKSKAMKIKKIYFISSLAVAVIFAGGVFLGFFLKPKAVEYHLPVNLSQAELQDIASRINKNMENLTIFPKDYNVYLDLGSLEFALGNASKAIDYYTKAWEIIPTNATPWLNIGNIYIKLGLYDKAEEAFTQVRQIITELKEGKIDLSKLVIRTQITRELDQYTSLGPHVLVAKRMEEKGERVFPGRVIEYVIGAGSGLVRDRAQLREDVKSYDAEYYIGHQVIPAVIGIFNVFGYTEDELLRKGKQMGLGNFF